jgi:hypothetical protein
MLPRQYLCDASRPLRTIIRAIWRETGNGIKIDHIWHQKFAQFSTYGIAMRLKLE